MLIIAKPNIPTLPSPVPSVVVAVGFTGAWGQSVRQTRGSTIEAAAGPLGPAALGELECSDIEAAAGIAGDWCSSGGAGAMDACAWPAKPAAMSVAAAAAVRFSILGVRGGSRWASLSDADVSGGAGDVGVADSAWSDCSADWDACMRTHALFSALQRQRHACNNRYSRSPEEPDPCPRDTSSYRRSSDTQFNSLRQVSSAVELVEYYTTHACMHNENRANRGRTTARIPPMGTPVPEATEPSEASSNPARAGVFSGVAAALALLEPASFTAATPSVAEGESAFWVMLVVCLSSTAPVSEPRIIERMIVHTKDTAAQYGIWRWTGTTAKFTSCMQIPGMSD